MPFPIVKTNAIVLGASRWKESSKIVTLFSGEFGYIRAVAKGAYRPKSQFRGVLESLNNVEIILRYKDSRPIQNLSGVSLNNAYLRIRDNLQKTSVAFAMLELLQKMFAVHEPVQIFFGYLEEILQALDQTESSQHQLYLYHFILRLSKTLGFGWEFDTCQSCAKEPASFPLKLDHRPGGVYCAGCMSVGPGETGIDRAFWSDLVSFDQAAAGELDRWVELGRRAGEMKFSQYLIRHLSWHTEQRVELKSLNWYV